MNDEHKLTGKYYPESDYEKHEGHIPVLQHVVEQHSNDNGFFFKVMCTLKKVQIGEDYLSKIVAENAADKLNMLKGG
jgi:hypothetical protein